MNLVTIITPSFNTAEFISETIESVIAQTFTNWELIIVDDNSSDETLSILEKYQDHPQMTIVANTQNTGAAKCRNQAIEMAKGRFIAFLDSDDLWLPTKLEEQIAFMDKNSYAFTYTAYYKINELSKNIGEIDVPQKASYNDLLKTCSIGCLTAVYDTQKLGKMFLPIIDKRQDYGLWLKILKQIDFAYGLNIPLAKYRVRKSSISSNKFKAALYQWKIYRDVEQLSFFSSIYYMFTYTFYGVVKSYFK